MSTSVHEKGASFGPAATASGVGPMQFYSTKEIKKHDAHYNIIFGERGNGKTTDPLLDVIERHLAGEGNGQYVRQMEMDIKGQRGVNIMRALESGGENKDRNLIEEVTGGRFNTTKYYMRAWYLGLREEDDEGEVTTKYQDRPFCFASAISQVGHDKSATPENVTMIILDEFIPLDGKHLHDETVLFRHLISTSVRYSDKARIYLIGNSSTWNSPYFRMFGINKKDIRAMKQGDIRVYTNSVTRPNGSKLDMRIAVEFTTDTQSTSGGKPSDVYFAMADSHSAMITSGSFAIPNYPECPHQFSRKNTKATYWITTEDGDRLRARLIKIERELFVFVEEVNETEYRNYKDDRRDLFYDLDFSSRINHFISPEMRYRNTRTHYLADAFRSGRLFFDSNETGENFIYYVDSARKRSILAL